MTEADVFARLQPLLHEVTGMAPEQVRMDSVLMRDLGAESLDLLDLSFLIEEQFGIVLEPNEFERLARARLAGGEYERNGCLTPEALAELRQALPELDPARLAPGLRKLDLPGLLTVGVFVHLIQRKLAEKEAQAHAEGKIALVTGGSGAVGAAIVRALAREGAAVALTYHQHLDAATALAAELTGGGAAARAYALDVRDGPAAVALAERVERELGPVDVLVNNAGLAQVMPFALIEEEDWDLMLDTNVKGLFLVTKAFARGMVRRKRGAIVNLGSLAGMRVLEVPVHYATAKSAVVGFTLALARELGRYHIRVNAVVPGMLTAGVSVNVPQAQREQYERFCTLGRAGTPQEVAELVAFLASDRAGYINAQAICVDGGI